MARTVLAGCASTSGWKPPERNPGECVQLVPWVGNRPVGEWGWGSSVRVWKGAQAQALGLCPHARVRVGFQASSGLLGPAAPPSYLPRTHTSPPCGSCLAPASPGVPHGLTASPLLGTLPQPPGPPSPQPSLWVSRSSIRQYELMVHTDMDMAKVYTGEMGRLKSYENQKP